MENEVVAAQDEGSSIGASDAERRRQERRKKILQNQESRLKKILGPNASSKDIEGMTGSKFNTEEESEYSAVDGSIAGSSPTNSSPPPVFKSFETTPVLSHREETELSPFEPTAMGAAETDDEGTLPVWIHRLILCALGIFLPLLDLNYFLVYFSLWELIVWKGFGGLQQKPSAPNLLITLILVMGLRERQVSRIQMIIRLAASLWFDFCVLFMSSAISQIVLYGISHRNQHNTYISPQ